MIDVEQAFNPETKSVHVVFQSPGVGYYIPLYQREYSWDNDNIDQLIFDINKGVENIIDSNSEEIRFLGTLITVSETNKRDIKPQDPAGLPSVIEKVIDGQQRLSTIALFATLIHEKFKNQILKKIPKGFKYEGEIEEICKTWMDKLRDIYSFDLKRGTPNFKPKIIRGNQDAWTKDGCLEDYYFSDVSEYLARYINFDLEKGDFPKLGAKGTKVYKNLRQVNTWLNNSVLKAHEDLEKEFPSAEDIINNLDHEYIWSYERSDLEEILRSESKDEKGFILVSKTVQLSAVSHYLLDRCCFTIIQPRSDDWAFDLFQSLNATGTPLTAIETFHPLVVNHVNSLEGGSYMGSIEAKSFEQIEGLFSETTSAAQKSRLTNEFLTSFAVAIEGHKLSTHFSAQRKWLQEVYQKFVRNEDKTSFIEFMGDYSWFLSKVWFNRKFVDNLDLGGVENLQIAYLKACNHKMAITVLASFYYYYNKGLIGKAEYSKVIGLIASFYTIWRSSSSNSGLDKIYRSFFKEWSSSYNMFRCNDPKAFTETLQNHFVNALKNKQIFHFNDWKFKSKKYLAYSQSTHVCKYALFCYYDNTIEDDEKPGFLKAAKKGSFDLLSYENWIDLKYGTIEHVSPQNNNGNWDENIYDDEQTFDLIGNLILLPLSINSKLSNHDWELKRIVYQTIGERDIEKAKKIISSRQEIGNDLRNKLLELNRLEHHKCLEIFFNEALPIWDKDFIKARQENILDILWDKVKIEE